MALYHRNIEKRRILQDFRRHEEEVIGSLCRLSNRPISPKTQMEQEKRIRREIANSNERRRMQSINAGFQSLRTLLPHHDGEKLSKAAILQQTAEYIYQLEQEKTRLLTQNCQLKRLINQQNHDSDGGSSVDSPLPKRKKTESVTESPDEVVVNQHSPRIDEPGTEDLKREMIELRVQLDRERRLRMMLEEQTRNLEAQLYPERIREIAHQVQLQYQKDPSDPNEPCVEPSSPIVVKEEPSIHPASGSASPEPEERIPTIMETSNDLEVSCPNNPPATTQVQSQPRLYVASTSRQNLETIVEAIRHLEGDHLFQDDPKPKRLVHETSVEDSSSSSLGNLKIETPYRQHVIQVPPSRPGVIVSTHA